MLIKIDKKEYKIEKLPIGKYADLLGRLEKIPELLSGFENISEDQILKNLPKILKEAMPELLDIISLGSGIPKETIETEFGITDTAKVIKAIFEVNEFSELGKVLEAIPLKLKGKASQPTNTGLSE